MRFEQSQLHWFLKRKRRKHNIRSGSYSQYGQDLVAFELLGRPSTGVFLDIGANDGVSFSNSLFFEEKGWQGICVEPHPVIFETLKIKRHCHLVNACIASQDADVNFLVVDGPSHMLSGIAEFIDSQHRQRIERDRAIDGSSVREIPIQALSPKTLLERYKIREVDFLSLDTEGCELSILKHFDFEQTPVKCISVENGSRSPDLFKYLVSENFRLACCVGCDEMYLRREG